ncbi:MAG TPA: hypothetical protein PLF23_16795, partial [Candidatus Obscuribacter sp.]|nr:hypothetical protein [Candidatus Obscuribacter sp.]
QRPGLQGAKIAWSRAGSSPEPAPGKRTMTMSSSKPDRKRDHSGLSSKTVPMVEKNSPTSAYF